MIIEADIETSEGTEFVLPLDAASYGEWSSFIEKASSVSYEDLSPAQRKG